MLGEQVGLLSFPEVIVLESNGDRPKNLFVVVGLIGVAGLIGGDTFVEEGGPPNSGFLPWALACWARLGLARSLAGGGLTTGGLVTGRKIGHIWNILITYYIEFILANWLKFLFGIYASRIAVFFKRPIISTYMMLSVLCRTIQKCLSDLYFNKTKPFYCLPCLRDPSHEIESYTSTCNTDKWLVQHDEGTWVHNTDVRGVSNHEQLGYFLNGLFSLTSKLRINGPFWL